MADILKDIHSSTLHGNESESSQQSRTGMHGILLNHPERTFCLGCFRSSESPIQNVQIGILPNHDLYRPFNLGCSWITHTKRSVYGANELPVRPYGTFSLGVPVLTHPYEISLKGTTYHNNIFYNKIGNPVNSVIQGKL